MRKVYFTNYYNYLVELLEKSKILFSANELRQRLNQLAEQSGNSLPEMEHALEQEFGALERLALKKVQYKRMGTITLILSFLFVVVLVGVVVSLIAGFATAAIS